MQKAIEIFKEYDTIICFIFGLVCISLRDLCFERRTAKNIYIANALYQKKFEIYQLIWERLFLCIDVAYNILNNVNDELKISYKSYIKYYNDLLIRYNTYHYFVNRWKPFCQRKIYENFLEIDFQIKKVVECIGAKIQENLSNDKKNNLLLHITEKHFVKIKYKENEVESSLNYKFLTIEILDYPDFLNDTMITLNMEIKSQITKLIESQDEIAEKIRVNNKIYKK